MAELIESVDRFFRLVGDGTVEVYNEFSLQHELGIYVRTFLPKERKVQFERPTGLFPVAPLEYLKREIDISVFRAGERPEVVLELKFPRNGQYPEQMFEACRDIAFLEQLLAGGASSGLFVMAADDPRFWSGHETSGIYAHFRKGHPIHGPIIKPTGKKDEVFTVTGSYTVCWKDAGDRLRYCMVELRPLSKA